MMIKPKTNMTISGDIVNQLLGLTSEHIYFLTKDDFTDKETVNDKTRKQTQLSPKSNIGIHHQMLTAFKALSLSAKKAGLELKIASGFRSFDRQLHIWNNKFIGKTAIKKANGEVVDISLMSDWQIIEAILLYSALPGASRHHWGCDIDVYAPNLLEDNQTLQLEPWEYAPSGPMEKLSYWLTENAEEHGFYLPYDSFRGGIAAEPWHLSYAPIAKQYQSKFCVDLLRELILQTDIAGKETIIENLLKIYKHYINNVNNPL
jgi:LAS superfamily LD-carboxypeptidase LdcB